MGAFLEKGSLGHYASMEVALNGVGFNIDEIEKLAKKTVITVSHNRQGKAPILPEQHTPTPQGGVVDSPPVQADSLTRFPH